MSFYGRGGFGFLPDFSVPAVADAGTYAQTKAEAEFAVLASRILRAKQIQLEVAPLLSRPEGAELSAIVMGLEASIADIWSRFQTAAGSLGNAMRAMAGVSQYDAQAGSGGLNPVWAQAANALNAAYMEMVNHRKTLQDLLSQYNDRVPAAAKLVHAAAVADVEVSIAQQQVVAAQTGVTAVNSRAQTFAVEQQLQALKDKAAAATAAVATPKSPLPLILIGVPVLGLVAYLATKRKKSSVAGYRRRRSR